MTIHVVTPADLLAEITPAQAVESKQSAPEEESLPGKTASESDTEETEEEKGESKGAKESDEAEESEEADTKESEESEEEEKESKEKPKKKGGFQRRIDKLNAAKAEAQREAEYWKRMALEKGAGDSKAESKVEQETPATADDEPQPEDYETHKEYVKALTKWEIKQANKESDQKAQEKNLEIERANLVKSYNERMKSFAEKVEDFHEVLADVDDIALSPAVREIILSSENGPELAYELAKSREEFARVCKLPPIAAAREMGKIEARIAKAASEEKKPEPKKITKAPKPIDPVGGKGAGVTKSVYDPNLSQKDYEALRAKQRAARGG